MPNFELYCTDKIGNHFCCVTLQATLVRNLNEPESGILYEYLAEASQVFPQVFPIV